MMRLAVGATLLGVALATQPLTVWTMIALVMASGLLAVSNQLGGTNG